MKKTYITPQLETVEYQTAPTMQTLSTGPGEITDGNVIQAIKWTEGLDDLDDWEEPVDEYDEV